MLNLIQQELFKLTKKRSTLICLIGLVVENFSLALVSLNFPEYLPSQPLLIGDFGTLSTISIVIIAATAAIIATESDYDTLKNMIPQATSRQAILISKWLTILIYTFSLYLVMTLLSLLNQVLFFHDAFTLTDNVSAASVPVWQYWLNSVAASFVSLWLLVSLVFLLATLIKKTSTAISIGIIAYFAASIGGTMMFLLIGKWAFLKWNPLNFLNYQLQLLKPDVMPKLTQLSNTQLLIGNLGYIALFLGIGLFFFARKEA